MAKSPSNPKAPCDIKQDINIKKRLIKFEREPQKISKVQEKCFNKTSPGFEAYLRTLNRTQST